MLFSTGFPPLFGRKALSGDRPQAEYFCPASFKDSWNPIRLTNLVNRLARIGLTS